VVAKPEYAFLVLFIASIIALLFTTPLLLAKKLKKNSKVPFGPFLITASIVVVMFGPNILDAYKSLVGL
jgi:prepilin signal peptidase PulO-like enzyme (type II secretory pathway)